MFMDGKDYRAAASVLASDSPWRRFTHTQLAAAIRPVTHISKSSRRFRPVISARGIATPTILSAWPNGILKASAFGRDFRRRIKEAHVVA